MTRIRMVCMFAGAVVMLAMPALAGDREALPLPGLNGPAKAATPGQKSDPMAGSLSGALEALAEADNEPERKDRDALRRFYAARGYSGLWISAAGLNAKAEALTAELAAADSYGLSARDFKLPGAVTSASGPEKLAAAELQLSIAALTYARDARGGRIADPAGMLSTNLDRRPQWLEPQTVLEGLAKADDPAVFLRGLQPKHVQFERLRLLYVAEIAKSGRKGSLSAAAKHLRANMEMWRWMPDDMGTKEPLKDGKLAAGMYVLNNIPEFMQYVYRDGVVIRSEKIVAGKVDKQSSIFSRPLKYVVLRPMWRVPESIKVNELWPSLLRGGGIMRKFGLQVETKDGEPVDWHKINWVKADIRDYEVTQPPGPASALGHVKFSFPSQHTIYMHDTPDKWMFGAAKRTLSHGCLRVRNPMALAEMILKEDKGWDAGKIAELDSSGPLNNEIAIDKRIPIHLVYFTAWVDEPGKLKSFADVYGHEKRVTLALDGQWDKIDKGRDHLAPVEQSFNPAAVALNAPKRAAAKQAASADFFSDPFGLGW